MPTRKYTSREQCYACKADVTADVTTNIVAYTYFTAFVVYDFQLVCVALKLLVLGSTSCTRFRATLRAQVTS